MQAFRLLQPLKDRLFWLRVTLFTFTTVLLSTLVFAEDQSKEKDANQDGQQIQIVADKLITRHDENYAEFLGNVQAAQGDFVMTSERLRIYYKADRVGTKNQSGNQDVIQRIVASGRVKISSDQYVAESERAEYEWQKMVLVLSGENSTVTLGKNSVTGSKITVYRKDGRIKVEGSPQKRVKAVFYSKESE